MFVARFRRFCVWMAILYGVLLSIILGTLGLLGLPFMGLILGFPIVCFYGSFLVGFPLLTGGILKLQSSRAAEIWWMVCGSASLLGMIHVSGIVPFGPYASGLRICFVPALIAGIYATILRFR